MWRFVARMFTLWFEGWSLSLHNYACFVICYFTQDSLYNLQIVANLHSQTEISVKLCFQLQSWIQFNKFKREGKMQISKASFAGYCSFFHLFAGIEQRLYKMHLNVLSAVIRPWLCCWWYWWWWCGAWWWYQLTSLHLNPHNINITVTLCHTHRDVFHGIHTALMILVLCSSRPHNVWN